MIGDVLLGAGLILGTLLLATLVLFTRRPAPTPYQDWSIFTPEPQAKPHAAERVGLVHEAEAEAASDDGDAGEVA